MESKPLCKLSSNHVVPSGQDIETEALQIDKSRNGNFKMNS